MKPIDLGRLGISGVAGAGLLLFCLSFYGSSVLPAESALARLRLDESRLAAQVGSGRGGGASRAISTLPPVSAVPALLERIDAAGGKAGFAFDRLSYRMSEEDGVHRYQFSLPLHGSYPAIRSFLRTVMGLSEAASLDSIELRRVDALDPRIEVQAGLSFYFSPGTGAEERRAEGQVAEAQEPADVFAVRTWEPPPPPAQPVPPSPAQAPPLPFRLLGRIDDPDSGATFLLAYRDSVLPIAVGKDLDEVYRLQKFEGGQLHFLYRPLQQVQTLFAGSQP